MSATTYRESAKIYQFPTRPRAVVTGSSQSSDPVVKPMSQAVSAAGLGGSWYHEAAVEQAVGSAKL